MNSAVRFAPPLRPLPLGSWRVQKADEQLARQQEKAEEIRRAAEADRAEELRVIQVLTDRVLAGRQGVYPHDRVNKRRDFTSPTMSFLVPPANLSSPKRLLNLRHFFFWPLKWEDSPRFLNSYLHTCEFCGAG